MPTADAVRRATGGGLPVTNGLWAHWDATSISAASLDPVVTWPDSSPNGRDLEQASASLQPQYVTNVVNGLPTVRFDGTEEMKTTDSVALPQPNTLFLVAREHTNHYAFTIDSVAGDRSYFAIDGRTGSSYEQLILSSGTNLLLGDNIATAWNQYTGEYNGASSQIRRNGGGTGDTVTGDAGTNPWGSGITVGRSIGGSSGLDGDIGEIVFYDRILTATERGLVEAHLLDKWGIA